MLPCVARSDVPKVAMFLCLIRFRLAAIVAFGNFAFTIVGLWLVERIGIPHEPVEPQVYEAGCHASQTCLEPLHLLT